MENKFITVMFPYPSGEGLHIGHWYNYAIVDSYCKIQKYKGFSVFQPFGYDSFGLPAENYAKKIGGDPKEITEKNIENFKKEMKRMDTSFEFKFSTHTEEYQKKTKYLFHKLHEKGLAYKAFREENYCPSCDTVLAREQVKDEKCERCKTTVEKKSLEQWFFKITDYAERLLKDLDKVDYPERTKKQQRAWIGKSEGYEIDFGEGVICFTTKPETILDVKFIVTHSKDGEEKLLRWVKNPMNQIPIPIYTSNYVVEGYGTGYVMGVPNDDIRDRDFAIRNNLLFSEEKHLIDLEVLEHLEFPFEFIKPKTNYKLRDWCVSRQRAWGCPIPIEGEADTLDTFVDSSFYTIAYDATRPVDLYVGGNEHACMHLIYARFITKFLYDIGIIDFDEPFKKVIHQGMILGEDGNKMSKSLGNTINPINYEPQLLKMYLMFIAHYFDGGKWQDNGYKGCERFRNKLFAWLDRSHEVVTDDVEIEFTNKIQDFKKKVMDYFELWKTNKVVSEWMIFYNTNKNVILRPEHAKEILEFFNVCF